MMNKTVVIGLGNPLLTDEGIGVCLVEELAKLEFPGVVFHDLGTSCARVLHAIAGMEKAVFIDCAFMGEAPGVIRSFTPDDVKSVKKLGHFSLHEGDLLGTIELSSRLGECPKELLIFGIQPLDLSQGQSLSPLLAGKLEEYIKVISAELNRTY